ncbi:type 1 glutamine amidotransferase [Niabella beijingensis]|uniref:type 1 glutamine amidotransferase n=1 Tax=Niabella beijingensis TaxID=2872700 RepID=UPI001CBC2D27|nr:type 1 glutamine amidotransferase [Niabella beijingensis]MBZ4191429.1 type 1 glutamine amidotransferase [Niabella beijingensis]
MRIHYLQHVPFEGPAFIASWLNENGHLISATRFFDAAAQLPAVGAIDALVVMGGPMGVYDEEQYAWLAEEKTFIKACISAGKKVLGICLGAQLLAVCLGAKVQAAAHKEIGWFEVWPTAACRALTWFYELFKERPVVFHWHGDRFDIPDGCVDLLASSANTNQAFYYDEHILGLQFHLEVTGDSVDELVQAASNDLDASACVQTADEIETGKCNLGHCNKIMTAVLTHWLSA